MILEATFIFSAPFGSPPGRDLDKSGSLKYRGLFAPFRGSQIWEQKSRVFFARGFFCKLQNVVLLKVFDVLQSRKTSSTSSEKRNAFLILLRVKLQKGHQKYQ